MGGSKIQNGNKISKDVSEMQILAGVIVLGNLEIQKDRGHIRCAYSDARDHIFTLSVCSGTYVIQALHFCV